MFTKNFLPIVLAIIIAVIVSFAVQGFISFVSFISLYLRGDQHILFGLPRGVLIVSGPIIAGIIVSVIYKLANLNRWHGPAESILAAHIPKKRPDTEAGLLSTLASAISIAGGASVGLYGPLVHFGGVIGDYISKLTKDVLKKSNLEIDSIDAFAATTGPGLLGGLLVGCNYAKGLAIITGKPFLSIFIGISLIVFKLSVITSPVVPSPLDVPKTKTPFL